MSQQLISLLFDGLGETLFMVAVSASLAGIVGVPLGIVLVVTSPGHILERRLLNAVLGFIVNATRSTPFIILLVAIIPLTRLIVGTSIGTAAAIVPLTIAATPFVARLAETSLREVEPGLIEAAQAMGASPIQIIVKVLLAESWPGIVAGLTITIVSLIGYSAMAGAVGGGGLGDLGIRYGYQRFQPEVMIAVVVVLIALVQLIQSLGDLAARKLNKRLIRNRL
jgi:D-methionine transport system permease protein